MTEAVKNIAQSWTAISAAWHSTEILPIKKVEQFRNAYLIGKYFAKYGDGDKRKLAYIIATAYYESDLLPIEERRGRQGSELWRIQERYWPSGYYGRGFVQITWKSNYKRMGDIVGVDLVGNPDLALDPDIAAQIIVLGMLGGLFRRGLKLSDYFNDCTEDWYNARFIINLRHILGKDTGAIIGSYAKQIYARMK